MGKENEELVQTPTNETENVEIETTEEIQEGIELTDTTEVVTDTEEKKEVKKSLKQVLEDNPDYQEEFNTMMKNRLNKKDKQHQREMAKYKDVENVLRTTLGLAEDAEVDTELRKYYENEGVELPKRVELGLDSREIQALANSDYSELVDSGHDAMLEEAERLAKIGYANLNEREKLVFTSLAETLTKENEEKELLKIGVSKDVLNDNNFIEFRSQFNSKTPIGNIYKWYSQLQPKKEISNPGSTKDTVAKEEEKNEYSPEDVKNLSQKDWNKPGVWEKVLNSMNNWKD